MISDGRGDAGECKGRGYQPRGGAARAARVARRTRAPRGADHWSVAYWGIFAQHFRVKARPPRPRRPRDRSLRARGEGQCVLETSRKKI